MTKKIVFGVITLALVAVVAVPSASAACIPPKSAVTFGAAGTAYWLPATTAGTASFQTWQLGAPGTWSGTGCPNSNLFVDVGGGFSLNLDLGACGAGCPGPLNANTLAVLAQNRTGAGTEFLLATVAENSGAINNYEYAPQGNHTMIPIPRPRVLSSSRAATVVNLSVAVDSIAGGLFGPNAGTAVTGFRILGKSATADPGRSASSYDAVPLATIAAPGGAAATSPVAVNCSNTANDQFLAVQIVLENGLILSDSVGAATRVKCDPTIANPNPKIKVAPRATPRSSSN